MKNKIVPPDECFEGALCEELEGSTPFFVPSCAELEDESPILTTAEIPSRALADECLTVTPPDLAAPLHHLSANVEPPLPRRNFLSSLGLTGIAALVAMLPSASAEAATVPTAVDRSRKGQLKALRERALSMCLRTKFPRQRSNGEERDYPYLAQYSKALQHNERGEVLEASYKQMLRALARGTQNDFENLSLAGAKKLKNPLAGLAFDLQGLDPQQTSLPAAPRIDRPQRSSEMGELYWMSLCRDVPFTEFASNSIVAAACADMNRFTDFRGPHINGQVSPDCLFRGSFNGDLVGPYVSQLLLENCPMGTLSVDARQETIVPGINRLTDVESWLAAQNGFAPGIPQIDTTKRFLRNPRDLAHYVHIDRLPQSFFLAALILRFGYNAPVDEGNPYRASGTMDGFATFDYPHLLALVCEVTTRALKAVWFSKWYVHRNLRPEEFGGRIHFKLSENADYPINSEILNSDAVQHSYSENGTYLLPMVFPEGCPPHPAYASGHATVCGACITILKAWFDENYVLPHPKVPDAAGTSLVSYGGSDADQITVATELTKLASNISFARVMAGIHWRSDSTEGMKLGEQIAIALLQEQALTFRERFSWTFTRFDGRRIRIRR